MAFYDQSSGHGSFVIHFRDRPTEDFGVFAKGYGRAARTLAETLLERPFPDYAAYPVVFLFRHALELHLKGVVVQGVRLDSLTQRQRVEDKLRCIHRLEPLYDAASKILRILFANDSTMEAFLAKLEGTISEFGRLDPDSFTFRYPVNKSGIAPTATAIRLNLRDLLGRLEEVLDGLEAIDFGLGIEIDLAQETLDLLMNYESSGPSH